MYQKLKAPPSRRDWRFSTLFLEREAALSFTFQDVSCGRFLLQFIWILCLFSRCAPVSCYCFYFQDVPLRLKLRKPDQGLSARASATHITRQDGCGASGPVKTRRGWSFLFFKNKKKAKNSWIHYTALSKASRSSRTSHKPIQLDVSWGKCISGRPISSQMQSSLAKSNAVHQLQK